MSELTAYQIRCENRYGAAYTKAEHQAAPWLDAREAQAWNDCFPDAEQYTRWEILKLKLKEFWEKLV